MKEHLASLRAPAGQPSGVKSPSALRQGLEWVALHLPLPLALTLVEGLARPYAALIRHTGYRLPPRDLAHFPRRLAELFGEAALPADTRRIIEARLVFVLRRRLIGRSIRRGSAAAARPLLPRIEVRGREHLSAALGQGRGVVAITTHFGFLHLIGTVLGALGVGMVAATSSPRHPSHIRSTGDVWTRTRAIQQMRAALRGNQVCVLLLDAPAQTSVRLPFFLKHVDMAVGPFELARLTGAPLLPFFIVAPEGPLRFRLELLPPIGGSSGLGREEFTETAREFLRLYATYAERYPSHLPSRFIGRP
jgi:lauroyl/myristoyl acyltransferase